jgi:GNAT superfamily N-acetyltransferase
MLKPHSIPMSIEEYKRILHRPGWKHEYWDGRLRLSPNHRVSVYSRTTTDPPATNGTNLETQFLLDLEPNAFTSAFTVSFAGTIDFVDQSSLKVRAFAKKFWNQLGTGARSAVHPASLAFVSPGRQPRVLSLLIFVARDPGEVLLDCVLTRPEWQGDGLATELLALALPKLLETQIRTVWSGVFEGNLESCAWHERNGFTLATDLMKTTSMVHRLRHEQHRLEALGRSIDEISVKLETMRILEGQLEARADAEMRLQAQSKRSLGHLVGQHHRKHRPT